LGALVLTSGVLAVAAPLAEPALRAPQAPADLTPTYWLTVTTTSDVGGSDPNSEHCETHSPCTLRRAINEARWHSAADEVFHIAFAIPDTDPDYDAAHGVWIITVNSDNSGSETHAFREFGTYGKVIIDGTTQPGGRALAAGPRIILRGDNKKGAFVLTGGRNVIRGLAFQGFANNMVTIPATNENLVEQNWFGLNVVGDDIYLRNPLLPEDGSGEAGIYAQMSGSDGATNTIQSNVLVGFKGVAISVRGDDNLVLSNTVGTRADGTVPDVRFDRQCKANARAYNWFAGAGIDIYGRRNLVAYNRVVGLLFWSNDPLNTPDDAIDVTGRDHVVRHNLIGVTSDGVPFGTCGEGISVGGAGGGHAIQVISNTVVGAQGAAGIYVTGGPLGYDLNAVTVQGNVILDSKVQAFDFGPMLPSQLRLFNPAAITQIGGLNVTGTHGADSPCADCVVEIFLDEVDTVSETLASLGKVTADGDGDWSFTLARTLALTEGLRTASTTVVDGQILHPSGVYSAGTTTRISEIYTQTGAPVPVEPEPPAPPEPLPAVWPTYMAPPTPPTSFNTVITVTTAADPDDSEVYVCYHADVPGVVGKTNRLPCTLRQAIEDASSLIAADPAARPVQIRFAIPTSDPGYDAGLGAWIIQLTDTLKLTALPALGSTDVNKGGQVVIDGYTQGVGGSYGPSIIIRGPQKRNLVGLVMNGNNNVIRYLSFQKFDTALQINHSQNIVEENWFGLDGTGTALYWLNPEAPEDGSGSTGIKVAANASNNYIVYNDLAGFREVALDMEGDDSLIEHNNIGTQYWGQMPFVTWNRWCRPNARYFNWFGGAGMEVGGKRNQVIANEISGMLWVSDDPHNTPDDALSVTGEGHLIQENRIGRANDDRMPAGVCGRGLVVDAGFTRVLSNSITRSGLDPLRINGSQVSINALFYRNNELPLVPSPAYLTFGTQVPAARQLFTPSVILTITVNGGNTTIYGAAHPDAPCPYCLVEVFEDDWLGWLGTLEPVGVAQSDVNGDWHATFPFALGLDTGLRTASTALNYGVIKDFDGPSTSRISSDIYTRPGAEPILLPDSFDFAAPPEIPTPTYLEPPTPPASYATVITVTSSADASTTGDCAAVALDQCTLRRAINQVETLTATQRPALIAFAIPTTDAGYNSLLHTWKITLTTDLPPVKGGQVTLDGSTQPNGRADGPKIILLRDSGAGAKLQLGEMEAEASHVLRSLAFQGVEVHMSGDDNRIEHNWLGLNDAGDAIYLYNDDPRNQNHAIIVAAAGSDHNYIAHNALAGSSTNAINLQGYDSRIEHNALGTLPDGIIPADSVTPVNVCQHTQLTGNWYGGGGIVISGKRHVVQENILAGLMLASTNAMQTQPSAIQILNGRDHLIQNNRIGVQGNGAARWTCGTGIENGGGDYTRILSNTLVNGYGQGIWVNGNVIEINATTMQGNVISNTVGAIEFGPGAPVTLSAFLPAQVTRINGTAVAGIAGDFCPYCAVDVFLDDDDALVEAQVYFGTTYADKNGVWNFTLPRALAEGEGLRTLSTTRDYGVVPYFEAGTSSRLSALFEPQPLIPVSGVVISATPPDGGYRLNTTYPFTAFVSPLTATLPITYTWEATDRLQLTERDGLTNLYEPIWYIAGTKYLTVTVENGVGGSVQGYLTIVVGVTQTEYGIYLPLVMRQP